jgi:hypothetical protein
MNAMPPRWAETVLGLSLSPRDRLPVSGDLLEGYRSRLLRGAARNATNLWYLRQVVGFVVRAYGVWALILSAAFVGRTGLDWLLPTPDFTLRATVLTAATAIVFLAAGFSAAWQSRSAASGIVAGVTTAAVAAAIGAVADALLYAAFHDAGTRAAIAASGGLAEVFTLPVLLVLPGALIGAGGGAIGSRARRLAA